jgi:hypothetical protein
MKDGHFLNIQQIAFYADPDKTANKGIIGYKWLISVGLFQ